MKNYQKPWEAKEEDSTAASTKDEDVKKDSKPKYEVLKPLSFGKKKVNPGEELPNVSEKALASLLRKGVVKAL